MKGGSDEMLAEEHQILNRREIASAKLMKIAVRLRFGQIEDHQNVIPVKSVKQVANITRIPYSTLARRLTSWQKEGKFGHQKKSVARRRKLDCIAEHLLSKALL